MKKQVVNFKTAKLAKELGFNWETFFFYLISTDVRPQNEEELNYDIDVGTKYEGWLNWNYDYFSVSAPFKFQLQKWIREKFNKHVVIFPKLLPDNTTAYYIYKSKNQVIDFKDLYNTYEEALEDALYKLLKNIENEINK